MKHKFLAFAHEAFLTFGEFVHEVGIPKFTALVLETGELAHVVHAVV